MNKYLLRLMALLFCMALPLASCNDDDDDDEDEEETTEAFSGYTLDDDEEKIPATDDE